ncbi:ESX secretion-associated protein EspG [Actinomycetospora termitidis]|uniref:ESX secretion-associated protein EspG n=1 Tax=Actinomycetospora termitidis TaxID=3053470 RepID=A0ABT7MAD7_9PSEU|nr:ESX secretion-associated protein EspG [Actinomycetospora sp. Odt1-22]MDL5157621.1 ESX secretion-associated protein EspG [Actinomycetospora sp. Odt1-22]
MHLDRDAVVATWRALGLGDRPPVLEVPDHGATLSARDAADHAALCGLRARGLARTGPHGIPVPIADLADALRVLDRPEVTVDLRSWEPEARGWYAAVAGELVVVVEAGPDHAWTLDVAARPPADPVSALALLVLARLPDEPPLPGVAMTVPPDVLFAGASARRLPPAVGTRLESLRSEPPRRRLQLGATLHPSRRRVGPVTAVDSVDGRALVEIDDDTVRVRPADRAAIARALSRSA